MIVVQFPGYHLREQLYASESSLVYRAQCIADGRHVVLKMLRQSYPTPGRIERFKREYACLSTLHTEGVVVPYALETNHQTAVLVMEDSGGIALDRLNLAGALETGEFLKIAIQLADILGQVHHHHIIHKDINPSNILYHPHSGLVKLIDFSIAMIVSPENPTFRNTHMLEGTLAYMSPEQTGRLNRVADYRTDFYSLGATFHELLTGSLPFPTTDALELVHSHIARQPPQVHEIREDIPLVISAIVQKLMAKNAEERYQSAYGLRSDLEECLRQWQATGHIEWFPPGQHDERSDGFEIPQKLYGRAREIVTLLNTFGRASRGSVEVLMVTGPIGIGKSSLVQELYKPIKQRGGYFISGKFDHGGGASDGRGTSPAPYSAIIQAIRSLVRQLLTESDEAIAQWRERILTALGRNAQVIVEVVPEVQLILGSVPEVAPAAPTEALNRFYLMFHHFLKVFTSAAHPLAMFLDDMHWADDASLKLLEWLITTTDMEYLFLIGSYRDQDIHATHPLAQMITAMEAAGRSVQMVPMNALDVPVVNRLVAETLPCGLEEARPLAELLVAKTGGNPFFLNEFLKSLYLEGLIAFDYVQNRWGWDLQQIQAHEITENVAELMAARIQRIDPETLHVLKLASCIGNQFDLVTLAAVCEQTTSKVVQLLEPARHEGLLLPLRDTYHLTVLDDEGIASEVPAEYLFSHDRIRQAMYSLIPEGDRRTVHWQVGQLLYWSIPPNEREERIFDIVHQLNHGRHLITTQLIRDQVVTVNLIAGRRAKASVAYEAAFHFFWFALKVATPEERPMEEHWHNHYDLLLALHHEAAEAAYLVGRFDAMEQATAAVLSHARSLLDKIESYRIKILAHRARSQPFAAVELGLQILELLGERFMEASDRAEVLPGLLETQQLLAGRRIEDLSLLPPITNAEKRAALHILLSMTSSASETTTDIFALIVFKQVNLSVTYGNAPMSAYAYANYGRILCEQLGDIETGYAFGQLALRLLDHADADEFRAKALTIVHTYLTHRREHLANTLRPLHEAYQIGRETGDVEFAIRAAHACCLFSLLSGKELSVFERELMSYRESLGQLHQESALSVIDLLHQVVRYVVYGTDPAWSIDEDKHHDDHDEGHAALKALFGLWGTYLFGDYARAVAYADWGTHYSERFAGTALLPCWYFYDSLARLAMLSSAHEHHSQSEETFIRIRTNLDILSRWATTAPMNIAHKVALVEAEYAQALGNVGVAWEHYQKAVALAQEHGFLHDEALAHELMARLYVKQGSLQFANVCIQDAYFAYLRWGAMHKARQLEDVYPQFLAQVISPAEERGHVAVLGGVARGRMSHFDLTSVIRASQAISEDIVIETVISKLLRIVFENAGADRGLLLSHRQGTWMIDAEGTMSADHVDVLPSLAINAMSSPPLLPLSVVNYVIHTRETLVLNDAMRTSQFRHDRYFATAQPMSLLCTPLLNQGKLIGVLYLENTLMRGVFTPDRLEILGFLSAQAAISIEKARLYANLEAALTQQVNLTRAYSRFVPREILQFLGKESILEVKLGDQIQQEMTVLFSDIRDFTMLSEEMSPQENFNFINSYLSRVSPIIREHHGFIDKYIGDAIMAIFPGHPDDAIQAAIGMQHEVHMYNRHRANHGYRPIHIGIGLHTGSVMLGTVGEAERMEGTVISDAVNLASRLEGLTKRYGASIIVSEHTLFASDHTDMLHFRLLDTVKVKGKQRAVVMCEILDGSPKEIVERKIATKSRFEEGLVCYHAHAFAESVACFQDVIRIHPDDEAAHLFLKRAIYALEYGPSEDWIIYEHNNKS